MTQLGGTTLPAGPDPFAWPGLTPPGMLGSGPTYVTNPAAYTIEAEGAKISAPTFDEAVRLFKRVRAAVRRRRRAAERYAEKQGE